MTANTVYINERTVQQKDTAGSQTRLFASTMSIALRTTLCIPTRYPAVMPLF